MVKDILSVNVYNATSLKVLEEVVEKYPYFQTPCMMYLKSCKLHQPELFSKSLPLYALHTHDRVRLHQYLEETQALEETPTLGKTSEIGPQENESTTTEVIAHKTTINEEVSQKPDVIVSSSEPPKKLEEFPASAQVYTLEDVQERNEKIKSKSLDAINKFLKIQQNIKENAKEANAQEVIKDAYPEEKIAKKYMKTKQFSQAMKIYHDLILQYPEKSTYFAGKLKSIKQLIK